MNQKSGFAKAPIRVFRDHEGEWQQIGNSLYGPADSQLGHNLCLSPAGDVLAVRSFTKNSSIDQLTLYVLNDETWDIALQRPIASVIPEIMQFSGDGRAFLYHSPEYGKLGVLRLNTAGNWETETPILFNDDDQTPTRVLEGTMDFEGKNVALVIQSGLAFPSRPKFYLQVYAAPHEP